MTNSKLKNFVTSLSLANLCFLSIWFRLIGKTWYYDTGNIQHSPFLLIVASGLVIFTAFFIWGILTLIQQSKKQKTRTIATVCYMLIIFFACWQIFALIASKIFPNNALLKDFSPYIILIPVIGYFILKKNQIIQQCSALLLIVSPLPFLLFGQSIYIFFSLYYQTTTLAPYLPVEENQPRVAWLLFDELDIRAAFEQRPKQLLLPNFDEFKSFSFYANKAYAGGPCTTVSLPALLTGKPIRVVELINDRTALLIPRDESSPFFLDKHASSVFSKARGLGFNCGVLGSFLSFHPYNKLFEPHLSKSPTRTDYLVSIKHSVFGLFPKSYFFYKNYIENKSPSKEKVALYAQQMKDKHQEEMLTVFDYLLDKQLGFTFVHFSYPHIPVFYSYQQDDYCKYKFGEYFGNVKLVDYVIASIKEKMEQADLWDKTLVIITSDHWFRKHLMQEGYVYSEEELNFVTEIDHRVPLIIKFPHQQQGVVYDEPFSTVLIHDIVLEHLKGNVNTAEDLVLWLDNHRSSIPYEVDEFPPTREDLLTYKDPLDKKEFQEMLNRIKELKNERQQKISP